MNPNANSFNFSRGAPSFVPGQVRGAPRQGQPPVQDSWEDDQPAGPGGAPYQQQPGQYGMGGNYYAQQYGGGQQPGGYYGQQPQQPGYYGNQGGYQSQQYQQGGYYPQQQQQGQQQQFQPQIMQRQAQTASPTPSQSQPQPASQRPQQQGPAKTISIEAPKTAAALNNASSSSSSGTDAPAKTSTISLSIGGGSKPAPAPAKAADEVATSAAPAEQSASSAVPSTSDSLGDEGGKATPDPSASSSVTATPPKKKEEEKARNASLSVGPPAQKEEKSADLVAEQVAAAADEQELKDLYGEKEGDLVDQKEHVNIVFIGHVDAGKSTMGGRVLVECGMVDKRTLEKYEKEAKEAGRESWYLSWALDSTAQERSKGKTVEVGRAYFETDKRRYTILDAPGHKSFVPSMISGAAQADIAILVISARKGEFETGFERGGQTREHVMLVKTAGISKIVVAINKMDDATVQWSKERYDEILGKLTPFMKQAGYNPKTDVTFIPVSGYTGANIKERTDKKTQSYYTGPALLEHLDAEPLSDRKVNAPLMMPISEKYKDMGTVIVGKVESGRVRRGDSVIIMPNRNTVEVTAIYSENEEEVPSAICGDNVRLRLRGIDDEDINIGFVISDVRKPVHAVTHFEAQLIILDHKNIICAGYSAVMHVHTCAEEINLSALLHYYDKKTGRKSRRPPQFAKKGQKIVALIEAADPVCIEKFDDYAQLGRFTLRDEGKTIAIGKVTKLIENSDEMPDLAKLSVAGTGAVQANGA